MATSKIDPPPGCSYRDDMLLPVQRKIGRPTSDEAASLRERVLDCTFHMLCEVGSERLVVDRLSEEANVTKRTIYRQFGNKEGLINASVQRAIDQLTMVSIDEDYVQADPIAALQAWSRRFFHTGISVDIRRFTSFMSFEALNNPNLAARQREWHSRTVEFAAAIVETAQGRGLLRSGSAIATTLLLIDLFHGAAGRQRLNAKSEYVFGGEEPDAFFAQRWQLFLMLTRP